MNTPEPHSRLEHFPVTFFGMVMGLIGLTHVILFWALKRFEESLNRKASLEA